MNRYQEIVGTILKVVGLGMAAAVLVLNAMNAVSTDKSVAMLGLGLLSLSMESLHKKKRSD